MYELTLEQQFEYSKMVSDVEKIPDAQLLDLLVTGSALMMRKNNIIKDMQKHANNPLTYTIDGNVFTLSLEQEFLLKRVEQTQSNSKREDKIKLLLDLMKELMMRDNLIRELIMQV